MAYQYIKETDTGNNLAGWIRRKSDKANIRIDDTKNESSAYLEYKEWIDAGNTPDAAD
jgi:hypothetical protein